MCSHAYILKVRSLSTKPLCLNIYFSIANYKNSSLQKQLNDQNCSVLYLIATKLQNLKLSYKRFKSGLCSSELQ